MFDEDGGVRGADLGEAGADRLHRGREARALARYRRTLIHMQSSERRRLIKLLESSDMKLAEVLTDVFGVSVVRSCAP